MKKRSKERKTEWRQKENIARGNRQKHKRGGRKGRWQKEKRKPGRKRKLN